MKKIHTLFKQYHTYLVFLVLLFLSISTFVYFLQAGKILDYDDANARLNIARGIIDNLKPGFGQLSNIWLPLPTILMLPFIWNNYLWHSGIAGAIVSMAAYIIGGLYLYKSAKILSKSSFSSFFATLIYALNINILYLQTTAMSEAIFVSTLIVATYNFLVWIKDNKKIVNLIFAGIAVTAASLIRYEGWAVMVASIPMVFFYLWIKTRSYKKTEGKTILYATVAVFGFILWAIYLTALYGDPLYWKNIYLATEPRVTGKGPIHGYAFNLNILQASWKYVTAVVWMNGVIPTIMAFIALPIMAIKSIKNKSFYFFPILLLFSIFAFMVLTLQRNTPIGQPDLTIANIVSPDTLRASEFNMRYGILMLPLIALLSTYLFMIRFTLLRLLLVSLLIIQMYSYFVPKYSVIYQLPIGNNLEMVGPTAQYRNTMVTWFKQHYDHGLILISAKIHNSEMLKFGYNYKTYIHEGTGIYWEISKKDPQKYATWIIFESNKRDDQVTKFLGESQKLKQYYNLVYNKDGLKIYKIKTKPTDET